jgi:hypothetical protein
VARRPARRNSTSDHHRYERPIGAHARGARSGGRLVAGSHAAEFHLDDRDYGVRDSLRVGETRAWPKAAASMPGANMKFEARWVSTGDADRIGLQHVTYSPDGEGLRFGGVVVSNRTEHGFGLSFELIIDAAWHVTRTAVWLSDGRTLVLHSDGAGNWTDDQGTRLPDFDGCIDIDISATPLTNTLPIRRLGLSLGERRHIKVVYIAVPELTGHVMEQAYTCLETSRLYRYEGIDSNFSTELEIDQNGLVVDYPSMFERVI